MTATQHDYPQGMARPFDPTNRAWPRLTTVLTEHFNVDLWHRAPDVRPILVTLTDIASGDMTTLAIIDSLEQRDPHLLLAIDGDATLCTYGPFAGRIAAAAHGPVLAMGIPDVAMTRPVPLADPAQPLPDATWVDLPDRLDRTPTAARAESGAAAVLLIDTVAVRIAAVGPFPDPEHAHAWPGSQTSEAITTLVVSIHSA